MAAVFLIYIPCSAIKITVFAKTNHENEYACYNLTFNHFIAMKVVATIKNVSPSICKVPLNKVGLKRLMSSNLYAALFTGLPNNRNEITHIMLQITNSKASLLKVPLYCSLMRLLLGAGRNFFNKVAAYLFPAKG